MQIPDHLTVKSALIILLTLLLLLFMFQVTSESFVPSFYLAPDVGGASDHSAGVNQSRMKENVKNNIVRIYESLRRPSNSTELQKRRECIDYIHIEDRLFSEYIQE